MLRVKSYAHAQKLSHSGRISCETSFNVSEKEAFPWES